MVSGFGTTHEPFRSAEAAERLLSDQKYDLTTVISGVWKRRINMDLERLLAAIQSPNTASIRDAEQQFVKLGTTIPEQFLDGLFHIVSDAATSTSLAQSAALVLKQTVQQFWSPGFSLFIGPIWPESLKVVLRVRLLDVVAVSTRPLVQSAVASIIARIGGLEYPDEWPDLVPKTIDMLGSKLTMAAGLALFKELLVDTIREEDFFSMGQVIMQRLFEAAQLPEHLLPAIECFHECINFFLMGDDDQLPVLEGVAKGYIRDWTGLFQQLLGANDETSIQLEMIQTIRDLLSAFPDLMAPAVPPLFEETFKKLEKYGDGQDPELAANRVNLLFSLTEGRAGRGVLKGFTDTEALDRAVRLCIRLAVLPEELQYLWMDDANEFVTSESELSLDSWPRTPASYFLGLLHSPNLMSTILKKTSLASDWVSLEACLFLFGSSLQQIAVESQTISPEEIKTIINRVLNSGDPALLEARALITAGQMAKYFNKRISKSAKLELVAHSMKVKSTSPDIVKLGSLKTISVGCDLFPDEMRQYQRDILALVAGMVPVAEDDTPAFLVDVFLSACRLDFQAAVHIDSIFDLFFSLVGKDTSNIELNVELLSVVEEILAAVEPHPTDFLHTLQHLLTPVVAILHRARDTAFDFSPDLQFALDLGTVIFERDTEIPNKVELVSIFYQLLTASNDPQILQGGSFAYAALLERVSADEISDSVLQGALEVAANLLNPSVDDQAAIGAGRLVLVLLNQFGARLGEVSEQVLLKTAQRLESADNALLIEGLTKVFCELVLRNAVAVVDLLASQGMLEQVIKKWLTAFEVVRGIDEIYNNIRALQRLYDLDDPRLRNVLVDDEAIAPVNEILTRSKTKNLQFTKVTLPIKILKVLIKELSQAPVPDKVADKAGDGNDDDEWDDELALGLDGQNPVDHRTYKLILDWFKALSEKGEMSWYSQLSDRDRNILIQAAKDNA